MTLLTFLSHYYPTQETNPMTQYAKKKTRDLAPGDVFTAEEPSMSITPDRWKVVEFPPYSDQLSHEEGIVPVMRVGAEENRVSWHYADASVYVETEERRSGTNQRLSDEPRTEKVMGADLRAGDEIWSFEGVRPVFRSDVDVGSLYRPNSYNILVKVTPNGSYFRVLPDRRSGEERRSGD